MPQQPLNFEHLYDDLHTVGLAQVHLLQETCDSLRAAMADATDAEGLFGYTHHLLATSQMMLHWVRYLVVKEPRSSDAEDEEETGYDVSEDGE